MDFFFADDASQAAPTRPGMAPLVAVGGIHVPDEAVQPLESGLEAICREAGFPNGERFKWSPRKQQWMYSHLVGAARIDFYCDLLVRAKRLGVSAAVVVSDNESRTATATTDPQHDVLRLFLERVEVKLRSMRRLGVVVIDRPGGDYKSEGKFLAACADMLDSGTDFVTHRRLALRLLSTSSQYTRALQLADLVTSCTLARVAGEQQHAPTIFKEVLSILDRDGDRVQGLGLKLHPDFKYANLYHWITQDQLFWKGGSATELPIPGRKYFVDEWTPVAPTAPPW